MGKGKSPKAPDPKQTAAAGVSTNIGSAIANSMMAPATQTTATGSYNVSQNGTREYTDPYTGQKYQIPVYETKETLNAAEQGIKDRSDAARTNLAQFAANESAGMGSILGNLPAAGDVASLRTGPAYGDVASLKSGPAAGDVASISSGEEARKAVEAALMQRMNPYLERDRAALESRLANQGITLGSEAWRSGMDDFGRQSNDARLATIAQAGQEADRYHAQSLNKFNAQNDLRARALGENLTSFNAQNDIRARTLGENLTSFNAQNDLRATALGENQAKLGSILSAMPQVNGVQYTPFQTPGAATVDTAGIISSNYQTQAAQAAQRQQAQSGLFGNLIGAGGMMGAAMLSDRRAKTDIDKVGEVEVGEEDLPVYDYRYKDDPEGTVRRGYMAQDVQKVKPKAVVKMGRLLGVDYSQLPAV